MRDPILLLALRTKTFSKLSAVIETVVVRISMRSARQRKVSIKNQTNLFASEKVKTGA
jgi:hypothetical protein